MLDHEAQPSRGTKKKDSWETIKDNTNMNKSQKGLPLETKITQNNENLRFGLIESLHMQYCSLRGCIRTLAPA